MEITYRDRQVGSINPAKAAGPTAQKGFDVVLVGIPVEFRFEARDAHKHWVLSDVNVDLLVHQFGGSNWLLGSGLLMESLMSATGPLELPRCINIRCSPRGLAQYETFRNGGPVRLRCEVRGKICSMLNVDGTNYLADPSTIFGAIDIEFSKEHWNAALRSCGLSASVLLEIPFPLSRGENRDNGLNALLDAFEAFEQGGPTAWKNSVGHIRPFLEEWRDHERFQGAEPGDGSGADRTWKLLNLREALYKCCHFWVHECKSSCTRQDAQLVLATFASLLQVRP
jgi:hypothetical protein